MFQPSTPRSRTGLPDLKHLIAVAHDSHNILVVGVGDEDIYACAQAIIGSQSGLAVAADGDVLAALPLPIAGLLSPEPLEVVASRLAELARLAAELGCTLPAPFSALAFLALPVIPELKLTTGAWWTSRPVGCWIRRNRSAATADRRQDFAFSGKVHDCSEWTKLFNWLASLAGHSLLRRSTKPSRALLEASVSIGYPW